MGRNPWIVAFVPIQLITAGGFLAVSYLKNRESTGDIDFLFDSEFAGDKDIEQAFREAVLAVADRSGFHDEWINASMSVFVTAKTRQQLFERALQQDITLFKGENMELRAAPIEWALERKLRRIHAVNRDRKAELDIADAIAILKYIRTQNNGPLDEEAIRTMNMNGFDVLPDHRTMKRVADEYHRVHGESIFK
ncbi:unnamed protein product [Penicillium salamii]|nr:unnamed protein product [Penicillium salamii]CAG8382952.1 unnamed protein product [Penicillium salamii]